jgi:hypothetical protein
LDFEGQRHEKIRAAALHDNGLTGASATTGDTQEAGCTGKTVNIVLGG